MGALVDGPYRCSSVNEAAVNEAAVNVYEQARCNKQEGDIISQYGKLPFSGPK